MWAESFLALTGSYSPVAEVSTHQHSWRYAFLRHQVLNVQKLAAKLKVGAFYAMSAWYVYSFGALPFNMMWWVVPSEAFCKNTSLRVFDDTTSFFAGLQKKPPERWLCVVCSAQIYNSWLRRRRFEISRRAWISSKRIIPNCTPRAHELMQSSALWCHWH